jgi:hypothetical protein
MFTVLFLFFFLTLFFPPPPLFFCKGEFECAIHETKSIFEILLLLSQLCDDLIHKNDMSLQCSHNLKFCIKTPTFLIRYEATCVECSVTFYRNSRDTAVS